MLTIPGQPGVYEKRRTYHYEDYEPIPNGVELCRISVHPSPVDDLPRLVDIAPGAALPAGWHWATPSEIAALTGIHPDWKDPI